MQFEYLRDSRLQHGPKSWLVRAMLHYIRLWDARTMSGVDAIAANSAFIARRIWKVYRREARVIFPPVDVGQFAYYPQKEDYYLAVSRMVPYKKIGMIVEAFAGMPNRRLVVIGEGPERSRIERMAASNITFMGYQPNEVIVNIMQRARAFVFAAQEDFGITPLEAQACGTPVIAFGGGGVTETVHGLDHPEPTGVFFAEQTAGALRAAVAQFEANIEKVRPEACSANAARFAPEHFCAAFSAFVAEHWVNFQRQMADG
jgi:glycosyltransferase involved in cell wall biosynthesis